jgi:hypothetical protein
MPRRTASSKPTSSGACRKTPTEISICQPDDCDLVKTLASICEQDKKITTERFRSECHQRRQHIQDIFDKLQLPLFPRKSTCLDDLCG